MQQTNLLCLPENYQYRYYIYHYFSWPSLLHVAEECDGKIVGYVLSKLEDEECEPGVIQGHITSLSVLRTYRRMGIAKKLMNHAIQMQQEYFDADFITLNVRVSNRAALHLYHNILGFEIISLDKDYYADHEDAYKMRKQYKKNFLGTKPKIIHISDDIKWDDIMDCFEDEDEMSDKVKKIKDIDENNENEGDSNNNKTNDDNANNNGNDTNTNNTDHTNETKTKKNKKHKKKK